VVRQESSGHEGQLTAADAAADRGRPKTVSTDVPSPRVLSPTIPMVATHEGVQYGLYYRIGDPARSRGFLGLLLGTAAYRAWRQCGSCLENGTQSLTVSLREALPVVQFSFSRGATAGEPERFAPIVECRAIRRVGASGNAARGSWV